MAGGTRRKKAASSVGTMPRSSRSCSPAWSAMATGSVRASRSQRRTDTSQAMTTATAVRAPPRPSAGLRARLRQRSEVLHRTRARNAAKSGRPRREKQDDDEIARATRRAPGGESASKPSSIASRSDGITRPRPLLQRDRSAPSPRQQRTPSAKRNANFPWNRTDSCRAARRGADEAAARGGEREDDPGEREGARRSAARDPPWRSATRPKTRTTAPGASEKYSGGVPPK